MSTSNKRNTIPFVYGFLCVLSILIICIYERFSQGESSLYMRSIPLIVLLGGFLPSMMMRSYELPSLLRYLYRSALSTFLLYIFSRSTFELYGSISPYTRLYLMSSLLLFAAAFIFSCYIILQKWLRQLWKKGLDH